MNTQYFQNSLNRIFALILWLSICHLAHGSTSSSSCGLPSVEKILPSDWKIYSLKSEVIPKGHYWGRTQEYTGPKGVAVVAVGPNAVDFEWQSKSGVWTREALAKESLALYFMPATYAEERISSPKGPRSATLVFEDHACRVYGYVSFKIVEQKRFDDLLKVASATRWVNVPTSDDDLTWSTWRSQLRRAMTGELPPK